MHEHHRAAVRPALVAGDRGIYQRVEGCRYGIGLGHRPQAAQRASPRRRLTELGKAGACTAVRSEARNTVQGRADVGCPIGRLLPG